MVSEVLLMSQKDRDRLHVMRQVLDGRLTWKLAGEQLGLGWRQVGRLCARVRLAGDRGVLHGLRGRESNRRMSEELASQVLGALHDPLWEGFGPTFAQQKLEAFYGVAVGVETVRRLMIHSGLHLVQPRGVRHRLWRERRACVGMLIQVDGSIHDWLEGRGPRCVLLLYIDDATGRLMYAAFVEAEDTLTLMRTTKAYLERHGRPLAFYVDQDSIYRVARQKSVADGIKDEPLTQFKRAMVELGIEIICANSPQAKGRVERSFQTHQDRLIKELRLAGISTIAAANEFLWQRYIPEHNGRYALPPANAADAHRPLLAEHRLERIFSMRDERMVMNDFTVRHNNKWLQILAEKGLRVRPKDRVQVETRLDGSLHLRLRGNYLPFKSLDQRPVSGLYATRPSRRPDFGLLPSKREVWRQDSLGQRRWLCLADKRLRLPKHDDDPYAALSTAPSFV